MNLGRSVKKLILLKLLFVSFLLVSCNQDEFTPPIEMERELTPEEKAQQMEEIRRHNEEIRKLTKNFSTFPSAYELNQRIDEATNPPNLVCSPTPTPTSSPTPTPTLTPTSTPSPTPTDPPEPVVLHPAAKGARKLLASFYQSCKAIDFPIQHGQENMKGLISGSSIDGQSGFQGGKMRKLNNPELFVNSHPVLSVLKQDENYPGPQCRDASEQPPIFAYASRKYPRRGSDEIKIFSKGRGVTNSSAPVSGIDCSSFVSVALAAQGLKISKDQNGFGDVTTRSLHSMPGKAKSCVDHVQVNPEETLKAGDIINISSSHMVIIDSVGKDPLGIEKYSQAGNCNGISPKDFNFTYVHSGAIRNSLGPSRVQANYHRSGTIWNNLAVMAKRLCHDKVAENSSARDSRMQGMNDGFSLLRHQSENPECVSDKKYKIEGEECINGCENTEKDYPNV